MEAKSGKSKSSFFYKINTTGLQPVSRPVEQILVFFHKVNKRRKLGQIELKNQPIERIKGRFTYTLLFCVLWVGGIKIIELILKTLL